MKSYKKAIKQALLPYILCSCALLPVIFFCVTGLVSVGYDIETIIAECWVWGLLLLMVALMAGFFLNYRRKLKKIREIFPDIEETVENHNNFVGMHFFAEGYLITFEIPAALKFSDIERVHHVEYKVHQQNESDAESFYIFIVMNNGKKYKLKYFAEYEFFKGNGYYGKIRKNSKAVFKALKKCCPSAEFTDMSPGMYKYMNK